MRRPARSCGTMLAVLACVLLVAPAYGAFGLRDPADRQSAAPLRQADLVSVIDGGSSVPAAVTEAWRKLPERCRAGGRAGLTDPCDGTLRCRWLAARYDVMTAFAGRHDAGARESAARAILRITDAMRAGLRCEMKAQRRAAWDADLRQAEHDDAVVQLALLVADRVGDAWGPVLDPGDQQAVERLLETARRHGLAAVAEQDLRETRTRLATARERRAWLARQPGIAAARVLLLEAWEPAGKLPRGCGESLFAPGRLSDQWRGWLVREEIPRALDCLARRLPESLRKRGFAPSRPDVLAEARRLAAEARRDAGGRRFGTDPEVMRRLQAIAAGLRPVRADEGRRPVAKARTEPRRAPKTRPRPSAPKPKAKASRDTRPKKKTKPAVPAGRRRAAAASGRVDAGLVALAERVAVRIDDARLVRRARAARTAAERARELDGLVIALHRHVCAPLEEIDPRDLRAARRAFGPAAGPSPEDACRAVEGEAGLRRLLAAAGRLEQLRWAAVIRGAARDAALGRTRDATAALERVSEDYRGLTWIVVRSWVARIDGDHVRAARLMSRLDAPTLTRLRASGAEPLARLVAHAWATPRSRADAE